MDWDDVRVLLLLLRGSSLHEAARKLGVDRSTVSRRVAALEASLGSRLMVRTRDGMRPTASAERMRAHAERMEAEAHALELAAKARQERAAGVVRVATTEALASFLVSEGLLDLREHHPELVVELLGGNRPVDLSRGEADVAVRLAPLKDASLRVRCVAKMGIGLFASASYVRARGAPRTPAQLRGHDLLLPAGDLSQLPEAKWLAARPQSRIVFRSSSMPALVAAAVAGHGIAAMTLVWGDREPGLERLMVIDDLPKRPVWLVTHAAASTREPIKVVADRIAALFARALS
jgi:DNA-binding transcriptional LysR family regulator